jgi:hypothetical protein
MRQDGGSNRSTPLIGYATMGCKQRIINERARKRREADKAKALSGKEKN